MKVKIKMDKGKMDEEEENGASKRWIVILGKLGYPENKIEFKP